MACLELMYRCRNRKHAVSWSWEEENRGLPGACQASMEEPVVTEENEVSNRGKQRGRRQEESPHIQ